MLIQSLHKKHDGESCAILMNGPTLSDYDLSKIDCVTIGVNRSWSLHRANYHVCTDDSHWRLYEKRFGDVTKLSPLITAHDGPEHAIKLKILDPVPPVVGPPMSAGVGWSWDLTRGIYLCSSISIFAFQVAAYMGFTTMYPLALDLCDRDGESKFHGHPDAWREYRGWRWEARQRELMGYVAGMLKGKAKIYNLSPISKCLAFPRSTFEEEFIDGRKETRNRDQEREQPEPQEVGGNNRPGAGVGDSGKTQGSKRKGRGRKSRNEGKAR